MAELESLIGPVARALLGEPNKQLSNKRELRYGTRGSLSIDLQKGTWFDNEAATGGGVLDLVTRETGLKESERLAWMEEHGFEFERERKHVNGSNGQHEPPKSKIVATYDYRDEQGELLFQVVRFEPKDFRQRQRDESARDGWRWSVRGVRQVPYRLTDVVEAIALDRTVWIVEGEKDVDRCWSLGIPATCNAGGAGKWRTELNQYFRNAYVVVVADNDPQKVHPKTKEPMFHEDGRPILPGQDHARAVAEQLEPVAESVKLLHMPTLWSDCPLKGDLSTWLDAGGNTELLFDCVDQLPDFPIVKTNEPLPFKISASQYIVPDPATIPRRAWLYGGHYMRGVVTATVAPGGFGKTTLALFEAMTMAKKGWRVWYISGEDDRDELDRRIAAHLMAHPDHSMELTDTGALYLDDKMSMPFKIAKTERGVPKYDEGALRGFEDAITEARIDVVIFDPFISFHYLSENDTAAMDGFIKRLGEIAFRRGCGVELSHHVRKPGTGQNEITVYDARGAGAIVNAVRSCRVLNQMTTLEAEQAEVDPEKRGRYIRIDNGKRNMAPAEKAKWFKLISVTIPNTDNVQAVEVWEFPKTFAKLTTVDIDWVKDLLRSKTYRADSRSPEWLGHMLCQRFGRDSSGANKGDIKWANAVLSTWVKTGVISKVERKDEEHKVRMYFMLPGQAAATAPKPTTPPDNVIPFSPNQPPPVQQPPPQDNEPNGDGDGDDE